MKERVTISIDSDVLEAARAEVAAGRAPNLSAAIEEMVRAHSRQHGLRDLLDELDAEHGPLTKEEEEWGRREVERAFRGLSSSTREH